MSIEIPAQLFELQVPELFVMPNPAEHLLKARRLQAVNAHAALLPVAHESRFPQHGQVFGDLWLAELEPRGNLPHRARALAQQFDNPEAVRLSQAD